ncbi:MAG: M28 family peptidase [Ignavibacteria bacterium]|nr:M28 family peptidase [Ignavibacteria bacterium]
MNVKILSLIIMSLLIFSSCEKKKEKPEAKTIYYELENKSVPDFDEQLAYDYIKKQISFGPRNPNSIGHQQTKEFLLNELKKFADTVFVQSFTYPGYDNEKLNLSNIIASFNPTSKHRILLCAHWDTRPRAEEDANPNNRDKPILGANDGASGVAILLAIAKQLKEQKINYGIDIVLFDGEDYGKEGDLMNYSLGAKYFIQNKPDYIKPQFGILLDMVGDKEAKFMKEPNSMSFAPDVVEMVWNLAKELNLKTFSNDISQPIYDDHIPLGEMGIKIIDIIDAELIGADSPNPRRNYWHTQKDTIENIGIETLNEVGQLLTHLIYSLKFVEK